MSTENVLPSDKPSRREFVQLGIGLSAAGLGSLTAMDSVSAADRSSVAKLRSGLISPGDTILFQGDSITDAGRKRDASGPNLRAALGERYVWLAAAELLVDMPDANLKIFNRGVSGNKVYQLAERWQTDCLDLKPNVVSILIGVNDIWHTFKGGYGGTLEKYETDYRALIKRTKESLPKVKLVICEPFVLKVGAVDDKWFPAFDGYRAAARHVADDAGAIFVPFQKMFDAAAKIAPPSVWTGDGVHPTSDGAALMAHWWLKAVGA
jgi:lysophospholipase L1-like esterase